MAVTVPVSPFLPEGHHAQDHPRAGSRLVLDTPYAPLAGKSVTIVNWFDRAVGHTWKEAALAGAPLATAYANRLAIAGLPDNHHAVVVQYRGEVFLVHQSELPR